MAGDEARSERSKLSIGALSRATDIPVQTLRTWERRYGFPQPSRTPAGHRRYSLDVVPRLRLVQRAIELGHRASNVVAAEPEALHKIIEISERPSEPTSAPESSAADAPPSPPEAPGPQRHPALFRAVEALDEAALLRELARTFNILGAERFVTECALPLLEAIGAAWRTGTLDIAHEHLASAALRDFVAARWRGLARHAARDAVSIVCATLPGERHELGLQLATLFCAVAGARPTFLGLETPARDIARACDLLGGHGVVISVSSVNEPSDVGAQLSLLQSTTSAAPHVLVGGAGARGLPSLEPFTGSIGSGRPPSVAVAHDVRDVLQWTAAVSAAARTPTDPA